VEIKDGTKLGSQDYKKEAGQSLVQIRSAKRRVPLKEVKRGRTLLSLDGTMIIAKGASLLKMLILN
jgi:hypothetical protein